MYFVFELLLVGSVDMKGEKLMVVSMWFKFRQYMAVFTRLDDISILCVSIQPVHISTR